jgi:secreted Zn-dependent insulinase-like peptidase
MLHYKANMANLSSSISAGYQGVELNFQGFNDGLPILVDKILQKIT